jgi:hypothetical protein
MREWLNGKADKMETEGGIIFADFIEKFGAERDQARSLIHYWDAERRNIPMDKTRKF